MIIKNKLTKIWLSKPHNLRDRAFTSHHASAHQRSDAAVSLRSDSRGAGSLLRET